eukprot:CAMPEP_0117650642 /NCGR_PEP_ID=MMETSP0804-20121206/1648_1 /TAXON_ID=1074897 /ORGANISM="Tetraselmis astigmatica, Strain CCMP880" /LENGTH=411 /DNA_ID=CAMNT_0005456527 /DNA_START=118 /DNA_END=1355 /DNA_ORIENTATION=+
MVAPVLDTEAGPLRVLQCVRCSSILGDTFSFVNRCQQESMVTIKCAANVREEEALVAHSSGVLAAAHTALLLAPPAMPALAAATLQRRRTSTGSGASSPSSRQLAQVEYCLGSMSVLLRAREGGEELITQPPEAGPAAQGKEGPELEGRIQLLEAELVRVKGVVVKLSERLARTGGPPTPHKPLPSTPMRAPSEAGHLTPAATPGIQRAARHSLGNTVPCPSGSIASPTPFLSTPRFRPMGPPPSRSLQKPDRPPPPPTNLENGAATLRAGGISQAGQSPSVPSQTPQAASMCHSTGVSPFTAMPDRRRLSGLQRSHDPGGTALNSGEQVAHPGGQPQHHQYTHVPSSGFDGHDRGTVAFQSQSNPKGPSREKRKHSEAPSRSAGNGQTSSGSKRMTRSQAQQLQEVSSIA